MSRPVKKNTETVKNVRQRRPKPVPEASRKAIEDREIRQALDKMMREGRFQTLIEDGPRQATDSPYSRARGCPGSSS